MKKMTRNAFAALAAAMAVGCHMAIAQSGLSGELDDLLFGEETEPVAETKAEEPPAAEVVQEAASGNEETLDSLLSPAEEDVQEEPAAEEPSAEAAEEPQEAAAIEEEAGEESALDSLLAPADEEVAQENAEEIAESAAAEDAPAEETEESALEEETPEEAANEKSANAEPANEDDKSAALDSLLAPAEEESPVEEAVSVEAQDSAPAADEAAQEEAPAQDSADGGENAPDAEPAEEAPEAQDGAPGAEAQDSAPAADEAEQEEGPVQDSADGGENAPDAEPVEETAVQPPAPAETAKDSIKIPGGEISPDADETLSEVYMLEMMRRDALDKHGKSSLEKGREEMRLGKYIEARQHFEEAEKFLSKRDENAALRKEAEEGIAESVYRQAEVLFKRGDQEGALQLARQARDLGHKKAPNLVARIQDNIDNPPDPKVERTAKRWNERDYRKNKEEIKAKLSRARQYYSTGEFDRARTELELILKSNPYEHDAMVMLERVAKRSHDANLIEFGATRASMIEAVSKTWTPNRYAIDVSDLDGEAAGVGVTGEKVAASGRRPEEETREKMQKIVIPEISFKSASISDVIEFFIEASREFDDPNVAPEQRGVNLILKLAAPAASVEINEDDPFAPAAETSSGGIPPVTFSARYMSLWDGLQYACELSKLKFRIRGNTVLIMPMNEADDSMVSRTYTVLPSIEERASSMATSLSSRSADNEGRSIFGGEEDSSPATGGTDWKQLFEDMGVKWPNGSSIKYLPSINKMRVLNTPENLVEFEKALEELNVTPRQVEIEARFVEVAQTDLESLGFEWLLTDDWEIAKNRNDSSQYIKVGKGAGTSGVNRYLDRDVNLSFPGLNSVNDALFSVQSVLTNPELGFVLHALSQQANTDLLSAPKVVTMNGEEAIIKVVHEFIYPTEFEIKENESDSGDSDVVQVTFPSVEPQEFEMREVGVILQVVPQVSEDGQMISLQLNPQIISEPEWRDYGFDYPASFSSGGDPKLVHVKMEQPIFKVRSVSTKISIYNGATVVMGGMITEERREVNDKVPLLGDIPLIGRLFRSTYEHSEKRNLLIFVTARMVDPAGRTLKTKVAEGPQTEN